MERHTIPVKHVVFHENPHLDEYLALWLCRRFGFRAEWRLDFSQATITTWTSGNATPDGRDQLEWFKEGYFIIGCAGKGPFNEHWLTQAGEMSQVCSADLVYRHIGRHNREALRCLRQWVRNNDTKGGSQIFDLAHITKLLNQSYEDPERVYKVLALIFEAEYQWRQQVGWCLLCQNEVGLITRRNGKDNPKLPDDMKEFGWQHICWLLNRALADDPAGMACIIARISQVHENRRSRVRQTAQLLKKDRRVAWFARIRAKQGGGITRLMVAQTDDPYAVPAAWYLRQEVVVVQRSSGNVIILTRGSRGRQAIRNIVMMVRALELQKSGGQVGHMDYLCEPGCTEEVPHIFYHSSLGALLNGSEHHPGVTPVQSPLDEIVWAVEHALEYLGDQFDLMRWFKDKGLFPLADSDPDNRTPEPIIELRGHLESVRKASWMTLIRKT